MRILISGVGIAGPTLAYWLLQHGHEPTLVEQAPALRTGGYVVDFWGAGFDVADRMGIVPALRAESYSVSEVRLVGEDGRRVGGFPVAPLARIANERFLSLPRGELASVVYRALEGRVETLFGESVTGLLDDGKAVQVQFRRSAPRRFDCVVGADGLHSAVRRLVTDGADSEHYLGLKVAAFEAPGYRPRDEDAYVMYTRVGQAIGRFSLRGDRTMFLFIFTDPNRALPGGEDPAAQKRIIREQFVDGGWETREILTALDSAEHVYLDRVSQIRLDGWSRGRVALVGDAAFCVSLLAGQGSSLAMAAAYVLAGEMKGATDPERAFAHYEERLRSALARKQQGALRMSGFFAPRSRFGLWFRNQVTRLFRFRWLAEPLIARELLDGFELPSYEGASVRSQSA